MSSSGRCGIRLKILLNKYWLLIVWLVLNFTIYYATYKMFKIVPKHYYLRKIIGIGLCISRGTAPVLNLSCCLVLLPMCRCLNTLVNTTLSRISNQLLSGWLSKAKVLHMTFAYTIIIASVIHTAAHVINAVNFSRYYNEVYPDINWATYKNQNPAILIFTSLPGITGVAMLLVLFLLAFTSLRWFRNLHYNVFWTTHNLSILFLFLLFLHPLSGIMKEQSNITEHSPGCVMHKTLLTPNSTVICKQEPKFDCFKSTGWIWIAVPFSIYCLELLYRIYARNRTTPKVQQAYRLPGNVVHLSVLLPKTQLKIHPGQFVLVQCEKLSHLEWHPFTVTSLEINDVGDTIFTVFIRARGDWSCALYDLIEFPFIYKHQRSPLDGAQALSLKFQVDGPYSSPMSKVIHSQHAICIAAGIGITAFVASLRYLLENSTMIPKRLHLIWIVRNAQHFTWFSKLIRDLHHKYWFDNKLDRFNIELYLTKEGANENIFPDSDSILEHRLNYGRPNLQNLFNFWKELYDRETVNVFTCGPKKLSKAVKKYCIEANFSRKCNFQFFHDSYT